MIRRMRTAGLGRCATNTDGIAYHVPTLMTHLKEMVATDRAARGRQTSAGN
jgi:hypothetical protein